MFTIKNLKSRIEKLDAIEIAGIMEFNRNDVSFGISSPARDMLNKIVIAKFESGEIDEIELIVIESGM